MNQITWTKIGHRLALTDTSERRDQLTATVTRMTWHVPGAPLPRYLGAAVTGILRQISKPGHQPNRIGVAPMRDGRQLIGIEFVDGTTAYFVDAGTEAVCVLVTTVRQAA